MLKSKTLPTSCSIGNCWQNVFWTKELSKVVTKSTVSVESLPANEKFDNDNDDMCVFNLIVVGKRGALF